MQHEHWKRNLAVCMIGSFTTIIGMTVVLPFLPLYVAQLGVQGHAEIVQWSGIAFGATFLSAALVAPLWGRLADQYGRKLMLIRASLGMTVATALIGMAQDAWQLVVLRLLTGLLGGYASGSIALVAAQTPKERSGWALGMLSSTIMAGNLAGPLLGGGLPALIGIRNTFFASAALIGLAFIGTSVLIREDHHPRKLADRKEVSAAKLSSAQKRAVIAMLATGVLLMFANMSIEPIITVYVAELSNDQGSVTMMAGIVMSATALGAILSAAFLGRVADRAGHPRLIVSCLALASALLLPQAFVHETWQLVVLRFLMGLSLGGLLPCVASVIRHSVPERAVGQFLGYSTSAQYAGQVLGPVLGGLVGGRIGMGAVFIGSALLMGLGAVFNYQTFLKRRPA
ncbi:MFS transporter [Ottowia sp. VDI28]|uniref:MFS transporter n=1 Tax=Ottowia sp. VDI28 TaxID=3133968 RepID=UPI003C2C5601